MYIWQLGGGLRIVLMCVAMAALLATAAQAQTRTVVIASGGPTGVYFPVALSICRLFNVKNAGSDYFCRVEQTGGSVDNLNRLRQGTADFAIVQSDWLAHAYAGTDRFDAVGGDESLRSLLPLYTESFTVVARSSSGIARFDDLRARRVNVGNAGSGQRATMEILMRAYGWDRFDFASLREFDSGSQAQALCDGEVDAIVFVAGHPSGSIKSAAQSCPTTFIPVDGPVIDRLIEENDHYLRARIPAGVYAGQTRDVPTFGLAATLVTTTGTSPDLVELLLKSVFENLDSLRRSHPAVTNLEPAEVRTAVLPVPLHKGAHDFFRELQN